MPEIYVGRQPILDRNRQLVAFELLFRTGRTGAANVLDDVQATASVIANTFGKIGLSKVLQGHWAFINFSTDLLMSEVVHALPPDRVVVEILETVTITQKVVERVAELKRMGFSVALDDVVSVTPELELLRGLVDVIKLDLKMIPERELPILIRKLKGWSVQVLAEKIDDARQAQLCMDLGCDLFQGYHFARPEVLSGKRADSEDVSLLRLLSVILADSTDQQIENEIKRHPNLTVNLLRIVNSAAFGAGKKIESLKQCVALLGRRQLQRWVQLLLYASPSGEKNAGNPLLHTAAVRARTMETLVDKVGPADSATRERAFMVGILSLVDTLLGISMQEIVQDLSIADEVKDALLTRRGQVGELLSLIESKEADDVEAVDRKLAALSGMSLSALVDAEYKAVIWADEVAGS